MTLPTFTLRQLVEAGVHFGHHARRWNPQMAPYIYGKKDNVHIIDLQKTYPMLYTALAVARDVAAKAARFCLLQPSARLRISLRKALKDADSTMLTTVGSVVCSPTGKLLTSLSTVSLN